MRRAASNHNLPPLVPGSGGGGGGGRNPFTQQPRPQRRPRRSGSYSSSYATLPDTAAAAADGHSVSNVSLHSSSSVRHITMSDKERRRERALDIKTRQRESIARLSAATDKRSEAAAAARQRAGRGGGGVLPSIRNRHNNGPAGGAAVAGGDGYGEMSPSVRSLTAKQSRILAFLESKQCTLLGVDQSSQRKAVIAALERLFRAKKAGTFILPVLKQLNAQHVQVRTLAELVRVVHSVRFALLRGRILAYLNSPRTSALLAPVQIANGDAVRHTVHTEEDVDYLLYDGCAGSSTFAFLKQLNQAGRRFVHVGALAEAIRAKVREEKESRAAGSSVLMTINDVAAFLSGSECGLFPAGFTMTPADMDQLVDAGGGADDCLGHVQLLNDANVQFTEFNQLLRAVRDRADIIDYLSSSQCHLFDQPTADDYDSQNNNGGNINDRDVQRAQAQQRAYFAQRKMFVALERELTPANIDYLWRLGGAESGTLELLAQMSSSGARFSSFTELIESLYRFKSVNNDEMVDEAEHAIDGDAVSGAHVEEIDSSPQLKRSASASSSSSTASLAMGASASTMSIEQQIQQQQFEQQQQQQQQQQVQQQPQRTLSEEMAEFFQHDSCTLFPDGMALTLSAFDRLIAAGGASVLTFLLKLNSEGAEFGPSELSRLVYCVEQCAEMRASLCNELYSFLRSVHCHLLPNPRDLQIEQADRLIDVGGELTVLRNVRQLEDDQRAFDSFMELEATLRQMEGGLDYVSEQARAEDEQHRQQIQVRQEQQRRQQQNDEKLAEKREEIALQTKVEQLKYAVVQTPGIEILQRDGQPFVPDEVDLAISDDDEEEQQRREEQCFDAEGGGDLLRHRADGEKASSASSMPTLPAIDNSLSTLNDEYLSRVTSSASLADSGLKGTVVVGNANANANANGTMVVAGGTELVINDQNHHIAEALRQKDRLIAKLKKRLNAVVAHWETDRLLPQRALVLTSQENAQLKSRLQREQKDVERLNTELYMLEAEVQNMRLDKESEELRVDQTLKLHEDVKQQSELMVSELKSELEEEKRHQQELKEMTEQQLQQWKDAKTELSAMRETMKQIEDQKRESEAQAEKMSKQMEAAQASALQAAAFHKEQILQFLVSPLCTLLPPGKALHYVSTASAVSSANHEASSVVSQIMTQGGGDGFTLHHLRTLNEQRRRFGNLEALIPALRQAEADRLTARDAILFWLAGPRFSPVSDCQLLTANNLTQSSEQEGVFSSWDGDRLQMAGGNRTFKHLKQLNAASRRFASFQHLLIAVTELEQRAIAEQQQQQEQEQSGSSGGDGGDSRTGGMPATLSPEALKAAAAASNRAALAAAAAANAAAAVASPAAADAAAATAPAMAPPTNAGLSSDGAPSSSGRYMPPGTYEATYRWRGAGGKLVSLDQVVVDDNGAVDVGAPTQTVPSGMNADVDVVVADPLWSITPDGQSGGDDIVAMPTTTSPPTKTHKKKDKEKKKKKKKENLHTDKPDVDNTDAAAVVADVEVGAAEVEQAPPEDVNEDAGLSFLDDTVDNDAAANDNDDDVDMDFLTDAATGDGGGDDVNITGAADDSLDLDDLGL